ncbi:DUF6259 domain-containing protein [Paenibacillus barengoltzii]|uniref:DUF6259 domain-containing protein n=1 Tax=Paenibacillus barengoltzii TaxID=343517 RepID=UPI003F89D4F8
MIVLENSRLRVGLREDNGAFVSLRDRSSGREYIEEDGIGRDVFRLETDAGRSSEFRGFTYEVRQGEGYRECLLRWESQAGPVITGSVRLRDEADQLEVYCSVVNTADGPPILSLEYPILSGFGAITDGGEDDYVVHSFATGFQIRNPLKHFRHDGMGFRYMPYPESFSGAAMQFFAYYGKGHGGLYFAALDPDGYAKWLNFYKNEGDRLEASFIHACEDISTGKGIEVPYAMEVRLLRGQGWPEAAGLYKAWAIQQPWCAKGTLAERRDRGDAGLYRWLYEEAGAATFGINAGYDRTKWLRKYRERIGTPLFHILGPDWSNAPQTFGRGVPGGYDDWFPTRFNPDNLACIREQGDQFAPFEFDYLFNFAGADGERAKAAAQRFPEDKKSIDAYRFPFLCPAAPFTRELHRRRDETLQREADVDAIYYDISANNILKVCLDDSHGHPVGGGKAINDAYRLNYVETKAAMVQAAGRYVPMGTEMMNETVLDVLDFYQARAGGQPAAPLEGYPFRDLLKSGDAELVPLFAYVYHEYGPVRLDGWGKLTAEIGSLFYFTVARTYLWGGLYELNYEYSPMEALDGMENRSDEHYATFEPRGYAFTEERADYLGMFAALRTGAGNKYLAYGEMLPPLPIDAGQVTLDWFHYNHGIGSLEYNDAGSLSVNRIVHAAWKYREESVGLLFANVGEEAWDLKLSLSDLPVPESVKELCCYLYSADSKQPTTESVQTQAEELTLKIPAHCVVLLEAVLP